MKKGILIGVLAVPAMATVPARADIIEDTFSGATLDPMWTLHDEPASYFTDPGYDGGFHMQPETGIARFDYVGNNAFAHIESAQTYDATGSLRVDAIMRQDHYPVQTWGMGVAIYFDANNYVALKQASAGGANGWLRHLNVNGSFTQQTGSRIKDLRQFWIIGGVEITPTQIKFYGSEIFPNIVDKYGVTDIDNNVSEIPEFTIARPASFTGNATVIIGKGFTLNPSYPAPHWGNSVASDMFDFAGIDYARIVTGVTVPGWRVNASGDWNVAGNWNGGVPNAVDAVANFGAIITSAQTVYTNTPVTVGTIKFDNPNTYQLAGNGVLTIDVSSGAGSIAVLQGSQKINLQTVLNDNTTADVAAGATLTIADPLTLAAGKTLTKTGPGTMLIEAPVRNAGAAAMVVSGGTARLNYPVGTAASASAAASAALDVSVTGSRLVFGANQILRGLSAATANAGDQEIDLASYSAQIYSASASAAEQGIYNAIKNARLSASGKDGIYDSTIASSNYAVGVTDQAVDAHGDHLVVVKKTILGDTNVDGHVDVIDLGILATSWQTSGLWDNGDSNFDGFIDVIDLGMLATNWQQSAGGPSLGEALAAYGLPSVSVPEPASIGLLGLLGGLMLSRKRRS